MAGALITNFQLGFEACGCNSRCFHCSVANRPAPVRPMPLADIRDCIDATTRMNDRTPPLYENLNVLWFSEPADHPDLIDLVRLCNEHRFPTASTLATNGERLAREPQLLPRLEQAGLRTVHLSFYAVGEEHDRLEGRPGAWAGKLAVAASAVHAGLEVSTQVFFRSGHGCDIAPILEAVDRAAGDGPVRHHVTVWMPTGRGKRLNASVPTEAEFEALEAHVRLLPNLNEFKTEPHWIEFARAGQMNLLLRAFLIDRREKGSPQATLRLAEDSVADVQALLDQLYEQKQRAGPRSRVNELSETPVASWAERVGDPTSTRMYTVISMRQEWQQRISGLSCGPATRSSDAAGEAGKEV